MSHHDYKVGIEIAAKDYPFYALIQAAMRQADSDNIIKLGRAWPWVWDELQARYNSPGGHLLEVRCGYCNDSEEDLRQCQLHTHPSDKNWQHPKWICKSCRKHLTGLFRYYKPEKEE